MIIILEHDGDDDHDVPDVPDGHGSGNWKVMTLLRDKEEGRK